MTQAFVLGAGLGTRLRPLTDQLPKPLIPVCHQPLISHAFEHLRRAGAREFIVNTHHLAGAYTKAFPESQHKGLPITFRHEPVLLDTAGGIANIADLIRGESFVVYNGDILTDLPLAPLWEHHQASGNLVTLALRSEGPGQHIARDSGTGRLTDIRNLLGTGQHGTHQFTGIYAVHPAFLKHLTPGKIESVIPIFLSLIQSGTPIGSVVVDEGSWWDLGDRTQYLEAHRAIFSEGDTFPAYAPEARTSWNPVHPDAHVHPSATLRGFNLISQQAQVGQNAALEDCLLWPGARVAPGAVLRRCIVRSGMEANGELANTDV
ncbi:nucleotidyltransferase family protein [Verrucomicrobium spinosum]|uniref:nucleotidyltransferase family protein n=1 Tax=Verrucomicrobium spinosum TaxID=2736 RepID=UPI00017466C8|nr:sugar phosphate nucleotidyltransferase [Verrucomicrobium spinosum]